MAVISSLGMCVLMSCLYLAAGPLPDSDAEDKQVKTYFEIQFVSLSSLHSIRFHCLKTTSLQGDANFCSVVTQTKL